MKKGYWVVAYRAVSDEEAMKAYRELAVPAIDACGGSVLVYSGDLVEPHEAGLKQLTVIVEFTSYEQARRAYACDAYQAALNALGQGAERDFRIVEGLGEQ
jgi:uncharacterized protein (DUF1330 family)